MASVIIFRRSGRKFYEAQWIDPITGKKKTQSTKTTKRREAERFAARIEHKLNSGDTILSSRVTWEEFRRRYEKEVLPTLAPATQTDHRTTLKYIERYIDPKFLMSLTAGAISQFQAKLREMGRKEYTIKGHCSNIRRFLRWAQKMEMIAKVPVIEMPTNLTAMRGRPPTREEFERMIKATPAIVGDYSAQSFVDLQEGLWWSGLRISEAMVLHWTDDANIMVDLSGRRPMFLIQDHAEKARKFRMLPMAPEFAEWLLKTPERDRIGFVFNPLPRMEPYHARLSKEWVAKLISQIGKKANVVVSQGKYASVHDFRRAFGFRWAQRVMPVVLMEMMRHADIKTTMQFYVGRNAEAAADAAWAAVANTLANTALESSDAANESSS